MGLKGYRLWDTGQINYNGQSPTTVYSMAPVAGSRSNTFASLKSAAAAAAMAVSRAASFGGGGRKRVNAPEPRSAAGMVCPPC
jgi:hypothetical protein